MHQFRGITLKNKQQKVLKTLVLCFHIYTVLHSHRNLKPAWSNIWLPQTRSSSRMTGKHTQTREKAHLGTASTEDEAGTLGTWQFVAAASFKADDGTALKVLGICRALSVVIEFTVATDEGTVNRMLFPIRTWVVAELAADAWWLSALWELEVCVIFEGCSKAEPAVDDELVWTSAVGVVLLRCKPLYTPAKEKQSSKSILQKLLNPRQKILSPQLKKMNNYNKTQNAIELCINSSVPEAWRMPFTPIPSTTSSFILNPINCSDVTKAEAANWALTESSVLETKPWKEQWWHTHVIEASRSQYSPHFKATHKLVKQKSIHVNQNQPSHSRKTKLLTFGTAR